MARTRQSDHVPAVPPSLDLERGHDTFLDSDKVTRNVPPGRSDSFELLFQYLNIIFSSVPNQHCEAG